MGGTATWVARSNLPTVSPAELFPAACKMQDGQVLRVVPRMTHHLSGDGELYTLKGTDNGNGTVTWGTSWQKIYSRQNSTWDVRGGIPRLIPSGPDAGKVAIAMWEAHWHVGSLPVNYASAWPNAQVESFTRCLVSTDESCTSWEVRGTLPHTFGSSFSYGSECSESPIVFLPGGDWLLAVYTRETRDYIGWYSSALYRSTDNGNTWAHEGFIGPRANTAQAQDVSYLADEPQLLLLQNGELLCMIRALEESVGGNPQQLYHHLYRCADPTVAAGDLEWAFEGRIPSIHANSRCALFQHTNGMVLHGFRVITQSTSWGTSVQGAYHYSNDNGATWTSPRNLDTGGLTSGDSGTGTYSYGDWVELSDGSLIHLYAQDQGSSSYTREARFSVVSDPMAPSITGSDVAGITESAATIIGNVNPNGAATSYHVEYGETTGYGSETSPVSAGSGSSPVAVEVDLTGLDADTGYHARLVATSANGTTNGPDVSFTTDEPPPVAVGRSLELAYVVLVSVGASCAAPFNVNASVGRSVEISYGVAGAVGRSLALPWNVNATVGRSLQISYGIETIGYRTMRLLIPAPAPYPTRRTLLDTLTPVGPFTATGTTRRHASAAGSSRGHARLTGGTTP